MAKRVCRRPAVRDEATHMVFVYGSLMTGMGNHRLLRGSRKVGAGEAVGQYKMRSLGGFPGAWAAAGGSTIPGELYEVDSEVLEMLDRLEGNGRFYERERVAVIVAGDVHPAWVYLVMRPSRYHGPMVKHNDWRAYWQRQRERFNLV